MSHIYPEILKDDDLWNEAADLETLLAHDTGVTYFYWMSDLYSRVELVTLSRGWDDFKDEQIFKAVRVENAALGDSRRGEAFITTYRQAYEDLQ
jgi:hypothetical protein